MEEAENSPAPRGTGGERVDVEQVVAAAQGKIASLLFDGTIAGVIQVPPVLIRSEKVRQEFLHTGRIAAHHGMQLIDDGAGRGLFVHTAQAINFRFVGDVFVEAASGLVLAEKKLNIVFGQRYGSFRKVENAARFERRAPGL